MPLSKQDLIARVQQSAGVEKRQAEAAVNAVTKSIVDTVRTGDKVSIFGFGTFSQTSRAARTGRNPRTGETVKIAASKGVKFSPASAFKTALNPRGAAKKAAAKATAKKATAKAAAKKAPAPAKKATAAKKR